MQLRSLLQVIQNQRQIRHLASQHDNDGRVASEAGRFVGRAYPGFTHVLVAIEEQAQSLVNPDEIAHAFQRLDPESRRSMFPPTING